MQPALYVAGKLIIGFNHGDAYGKLTECEKNQKIQSGFIDNFKFITDDYEFYLKKILLIRHATALNNYLTDEGKQQLKQVVITINNLKLTEYNGFCSPLNRCVETAHILENYCNIHFSINENIGEQTTTENNEMFLDRIKHVLDILPEKSFIISHCDFIKIMTQLTTGTELLDVPNCNIILIENNKCKCNLSPKDIWD